MSSDGPFQAHNVLGRIRAIDIVWRAAHRADLGVAHCVYAGARDTSQRVAPMPMRSMPGRRLATRCPDTEEMRELVEAGHYRRHCKGYVKNLIRLVRRITDTSCHTLRHSWTLRLL